MASRKHYAPLFILGLCVLGCGSLRARPVTPEAVVREFAIAISANDYERAYGLMCASYRGRVKFEDFRSQLEADPEEAIALANALSRITRRARDDGSFNYGDGQTLRLVQTADSWRIATDIANFYDQSTPRAALQAFVRALERRRYDVIMRLLPSRDKDGVTPEEISKHWSGEERLAIDRLLRSLQDNLNSPIEEAGDRATMAYGERLSVEFARENGLWKIDAVE
jgi:hypothetical protein